MAGEALALWGRIARALETGEPLDDECAAYLREAAQAAELLAQVPHRPPKQAARDILAVLGLTGADLAAHRQAIRDRWLAHLDRIPDLAAPGAKAAERVQTVANIAGMTPRRIYQRRKR